MQVSELMTRGVPSMAPHETLMRAAQTMGDLHVGVIAVCDGERLVGIVTDRDIVLRGVAEGCAVEETPLSEVMSKDTRWCFEDQAVDEVVQEMRAAQIRRVPVVDRDRHLVGMLSLGDVSSDATATTARPEAAGISHLHTRPAH